MEIFGDDCSFGSDSLVFVQTFSGIAKIWVGRLRVNSENREMVLAKVSELA